MDATSQLSMLGKDETLSSVCSLLSIRKVVHMSKKEQLSDAFFVPYPTRSDDLTDINEEDNEVYSKLIPGSSDAEMELRYLIKKNKDLLRTEYTSFEDVVHTSDVIPLVPDAEIRNRPVYR